MRKYLRKYHQILLLFGLNLLTTKAFVLNIFWYLKCLISFKSKIKNNENFKLKLFPILGENKSSAGSLKSIYFIQDLFVSQLIFNQKPDKILDIGSRIDGFVGHVSSFREIDVVDIRPLNNNIKNINFKVIDLMQDISSLKNKYDCVTCLHVIEHFGLGRYGDPIDPDGHLKGLKNMYEILKDNGTLYLSFPIGENRIEFNAHRVFSIAYIKPILEGYFTIDKFSYISDNAELKENIDIERGIKDNFNCSYGCGIFKLNKKLTGKN